MLDTKIIDLRKETFKQQEKLIKENERQAQTIVEKEKEIKL